jgi:amidase
MNLLEYASYDALGLASLVKSKQVTARELTALAFEAVAKVNTRVNAVVETYDDRREAASLGKGAFEGVPFLIKDVFGHEKGRLCEFGSRLAKGNIVEYDSHIAEMLRKSGVNIMGRSAAPEYSMSGTTESVLHGNTSNPFKHGYSAGGSSGGAAAAVASGIVPIAHGSDIGGSIRIPASFCGGVGLKPSRGRVSIGPLFDEVGFGYSMNLIQAKTIRDTAAMLDCLSTPQTGDPFAIPKPRQSYTSLMTKPAKPLKIGIVFDEHYGVTTCPEVREATHKAARLLEAQGHHVSEASATFGRDDVYELVHDLFFFGFDVRMEGFAKKHGRKISLDTLEPVTMMFYELAKTVTPARFFAANMGLNQARRHISRFWNDYDIMLSPTTAKTAAPWGTYNLSKAGATIHNMKTSQFSETIQNTIPHNIMGTPAISLPLYMHSNGLPIGTQLAAAPAKEHILLQLAAGLEAALPWATRVPELHVSH